MSEATDICILFFLLFFGVVILYVFVFFTLMKRLQTMKRKGHRYSFLSRCRHCGYVTHNEYGFCPRCGENFPNNGNKGEKKWVTAGG